MTEALNPSGSHARVRGLLLDAAFQHSRDLSRGGIDDYNLLFDHGVALTLNLRRRIRSGQRWGWLAGLPPS